MAASPLGTSLGAARRSAFVGRQAERELLAAAVADDDPGWSVLWIHGPGGVGKSSLLAQLAADADDAGAEVVVADGRSLAQSPSAARTLEEILLAAPSSDAARVVLIDSLEQLVSVEPWLRTEVLSMLPPGVLVVVADRHPPGDDWLVDPAWRERLRIVALRNLDAADADRYLDHFELDADIRAVLVDVSYGYPLALSLFADLAARSNLRPSELELGLAASPDTVGTLLARIVDEVPSDEHRRLLEVAAVARVTTEALVREALEVDRVRSRELFDWLRSRSYMETGTEGVRPHDLVRDVLDADLRWRDADAYADVFRRVRRHIHRRLEVLSGAAQRRAIADEKFAFRNLSSVLSPVDWSSWGDADPEPAAPGDRDSIVSLVHGFEGSAAAAIAERWWERLPGGFHVLRDRHGDVQGFIALVTLTEVARDDLAFDPIASAAMAFAEREAPPRAGEAVSQTRFVIDRGRYQAPSPTLNAVPILTLQHYLQTPDLSWDFLTLFEPDALNDYFAMADLFRAEGADVIVDGRRYGLFAHDFRRVPVRAWLERVTDRALAQDPAPPSPSPAELVVLSHETFTEAVRQALRDLTRLDRLAANPLTRSRLIHDQPDGVAQPGRALGRVVQDAVAVLASNPRDEKRHRALTRTYLTPAPSQERAAEALGLPFSTYRRHLTEGVDAVVARLWDQELHGPRGR